MLASALLVVLCAGPPAPPAAPPLPQQSTELNRAVEKRLQVLTAVARLVRPPPQATGDDVIALQAALSDALDALAQMETFAVKNAAALKVAPKDLDYIHKVRTSLDELLRSLSETKDAPAVAARIGAQFAAKQPQDTEVEARANLKALRVAEISFYQELDRYSANYQEVGFLPEGCRDGTRPPVPDSTWIASCRFLYRVQVKGTCPDCTFEAIAKGGADPVRGVVYTITNASDSEPTRVESRAR